MSKQKKELSIPKPRPTRKQVTAAKVEMDALLRERFIRSFFGMPGYDELIEGNNYVIGADGLYMVRKNRVGLFTTRVAETNGAKIPLVGNGEQPVEGFTMTIEDRIPHQFLLQTVAFFKEVYEKKKGAEAVVQIFYNAEGKEYFFNIDTQGVSGGKAEMDRNAELETNHILVADIHSHNHMGAFFSGTDNADEKEARIYGVMGKVNTPWPEMLFRAGDGKGGWIQLNPFDVFETPDVNVGFPDEWMKNVHSPADYKKKSEYYKDKPLHHVEQRDYMDPRDNSFYDRYVPQSRRAYRGTQPSLFGKAGTTEQDNLIYPVERWEEEIGWLDGDEMELLPFDFQNGDISLAIESLIESAHILDGDDLKEMWLSLVDQLDTMAVSALKEIIDGSTK
jgi:PRTRC genetic system protein A